MKIRHNRTFSMRMLYLLKYILNKWFHTQMTKLSICYYYDDGKIHSIYINWYWHEDNATENIVETLYSLSWRQEELAGRIFHDNVFNTDLTVNVVKR